MMEEGVYITDKRKFYSDHVFQVPAVLPGLVELESD